jgi:hypothetical protein
MGEALQAPDRRVGTAESCAVRRCCYVHIVQFGLLAGGWFANDVAYPAGMLASASGAL